MDMIFRTAIAEKWGTAEEVAEAREMESFAAAACRRDMEEDERAAGASASASAAAPRKRTREEEAEDQHNQREAAIDSQVDPPKQKAQKKDRKHPHGTITHEAWEQQEYTYAKMKMQEGINPNRSATGKMFDCIEWRRGKHVHIRGVDYGFQIMAYIANHPEDVLQQGMSVVAYPCNNALCIHPEHLFLRRENKRGPKHSNLPPFDAEGLKCVSRSQEAMYRVKEELQEPDESLTDMISVFDYCNMTQQQQTEFQQTVHKKK